MSTSELFPARAVMVPATARREPDMQVLAAANRQPDPAHQIPQAQRRTIITVEQANCRWPIGDPQDSGFYLCGAKTNGQHSYCAHHMQMAYIPALKIRRAA